MIKLFNNGRDRQAKTTWEVESNTEADDENDVSNRS